MTDINNITPAGGNEAGKPQAVDPATVTPAGETTPTTETTPENTPDDKGTPPPSNAERAAAKAKREEEEKAKAEADAAEAEGEGEGDDGSETNEELDTSVWGDAGDEVANSVLTTLQNSGVTTDDAKALLWDAVAEGDPSKVDRDALIEKVGKANATLIMAGIENVTQRNNNKLQEVMDIANTAAGGEANWVTARTWALKALPEGEVEEYREMLDAGGEKAKYAASQIVAKYNNDPKNTSLTAGNNALTPDNKGKSTVEPITRRQYGEQLDKLYRTKASPAQFNALKLQRKAGVAAGI